MSMLTQLIVERVLNSLPEGLLIALFAWMLLRLMRRQNAGTRFAVWMVALCGVLLLPFFGSLGAGGAALSVHPEIAVPEFTVPEFWAAGFFLLWIIVALVALARVVAGIAQVRYIRRSCTEVAVADLDPTLQDVLGHTKRPVKLMVSDKVRVPAAIGFRNPAIVLPAWTLRELSAEELRPILIHELAHLRRHDDWTNLLQKAARAIFFFHPAVWWIDARLSLEREMACDDAVLAATGNPRAYAGCLIGLLERSCSRRGWTMAQAAVARAREASLRIARILHVGAPRTTRVGRVALGFAASLSLACTGIMFLTPQLLVFAPEGGTAMQARSAALPDSGVSFPSPPTVVATTFHPRQRTSLVHRTAMVRRRGSYSPRVRRLAAPELRPAAAPVVMASLVRPAQRHWTPAAGRRKADMSGALPVPSADGSMLVVVEADFSSATPASVNRRSDQLGSGGASAVQVQTLQFVDQDANGFHVQILRLVLVAPSQNPNQSEVRAHSI